MCVCVKDLGQNLFQKPVNRVQLAQKPFFSWIKGTLWFAVSKQQQQKKKHNKNRFAKTFIQIKRRVCTSGEYRLLKILF